MTRSYIPLNALRAFEAAARHLSFTNAAIELNVSHSAISQQVKALEQQLHCQLFVRVSRGLVLTTEGENLLPVLNDSFDRIAGMLDRFAKNLTREKLKIGVVGTFATGFLLPRLEAFQREYPHIDLHLSTHNNRVDPAAEGLDYTLRYGGGAWHDTEATFLCDAPLTPLCCGPRENSRLRPLIGSWCLIRPLPCLKRLSSARVLLLLRWICLAICSRASGLCSPLI